ncbi:MAG: 2-dehydropantoate 2-reductase [Deltaproteobacteria bacterium]|nr:2-dehydropantoate 2-reductase [Deltaproteobacteria bacterium]
MRIAVMGTGGIGGYFGARLAQGGSDVVFVARGAHLAALRERGLTVQSKLGHVSLPKVQATDDPSTLGSVDVALIGVKLWDTEAAAHAVSAIVGPTTAVLSLQNGVQKDDVLRHILGSETVLGGVCYIASTIVRPGVISHTGTLQKLVFGEYDGRRSARAEAFLEACRRGGIDTELSLDIRKAIWEKFVFLVGLSATTTTIRLPIGPIRTNPRTRRFLLDIMREVVAVGRAHGVALSAEYAEDRLVYCDGLPAEMVSSMYHDLERGNRLEVDWLSGGVVELGQAAGVPTPVNRAVSDILALHANGKPKA